MQSTRTLPVNWKRDSIRSIVDPVRPITYGVVQPGERLKQGIPIIRGQDYSRGVVDHSDLYLIHPNIADAYKRSSVEGGDILFSIVGYLGQTAVVPASLRGANITQTTARIAVKPPNVSRFFLHQFRSDLFAPEVRKHQKGSAQPGVNLSDVEKMLVVIPPPEDQTRIAAVLDTVDEAIAKTEAVIAKLKQVRAGLLHDFLTRGLDENGQLRDPIAHPEQFKDSPLGRIPKEWEVATVEELDLLIIDGDRGSNYPNESQLFEQGYCVFLNNKNIVDGRFDFSAAQFISEERDALLGKGKLSGGDIVITTRGTVGNIALFSELRPYQHIRINSGMIIVRGYEDIFVDGFFVAVWKFLFPSEYRRLSSGSAQPQFPIRDMKQFRFLVPKKAEQERIVSASSTVESALAEQQRVLAKLIPLKSGLMNDLLTGRVRVAFEIGNV